MWCVEIKSESRTVSRVRKPDKNFKPDENFELRWFNVVEDMVEISYPIFVTLWEWDKMWIEWIKFYYPDQFHPKRHLISFWLSFYQIISLQQNLKSDLNSCVVFFVKKFRFQMDNFYTISISNIQWLYLLKNCNLKFQIVLRQKFKNWAYLEKRTKTCFSTKIMQYAMQQLNHAISIDR